MIKVVYPVEINEDELLKYDPKNEFYSDVCSTYTNKYNTDVTLEDRQN